MDELFANHQRNPDGDRDSWDSLNGEGRCFNYVIDRLNQMGINTDPLINLIRRSVRNEVDYWYIHWYGVRYEFGIFGNFGIFAIGIGAVCIITIGIYANGTVITNVIGAVLSIADGAVLIVTVGIIIIDITINNQ